MTDSKILMEELKDIEETKKAQYSKNQWGSKKRKNTLRKGATFDFSFVEPIARMTALGFTEKDLGFIFGVTGEAVHKWKSRYPELKEEIANLKPVAGTHFVAQMTRSAMGYEYEEETKRFVPRVDEETGEVGEVLQTRTIKTKHQPGNPQLAMFMAVNLWPDLFKNKFEISKNETKIEFKAELTGEEIKSFAGKLLEISDEVKSKKVESKIINEQ